MISKACVDAKDSHSLLAERVESLVFQDHANWPRTATRTQKPARLGQTIVEISNNFGRMKRAW
jgi:hypothetical protein